MPTVGNVASRDKPLPPRPLLQAGSIGRVVSGPHLTVTRLRQGAIQSSDGHSFVFFDDVAWDDPDGDGKDRPSLWLQEMGLDLIAPEVGSTPAGTMSPASPSFMPEQLQRLRC
ncbi:hypothetical protein [Singulisphaera sp. GP187]|uniref:hypothetical protein n=1 Tax=Singulisphaera sp. GP187 TaxID=1882752 RepID=UPI000940D73A|nr:hypothetical protein [Singulisphaera sp. GP187]